MYKLEFNVKYMRNGSILRQFNAPVARQVLHGVYFNGLPYLPDMDAVKANMPTTLHKAIERGLGFWTDKHSDVVSMDLHGYSRSYCVQGKPLGTLFATALWKATPCRLEGYSYGHLNASAVQVSQRLFQVASDDGNVSIHVGAGLASSRLEASRRDGSIPVFFYE